MSGGEKPMVWDPGDGVDSLLGRADELPYAAKKAGRTGCWPNQPVLVNRVRNPAPKKDLI
jgi:hypothetical protein